MGKYVIQKSENKPNHWVCTDTENGLVCIFKEKEFNQTQRNILLNDIEKPNAIIVARWAREMCDWLQKNHKNIL